MTKPFDPHKPCKQRIGHPAKVVAILEEPLDDGETIIAVTRDGAGRTCLRSFFDNGHFSYRESTCPFDLVNIPERVEIEAWAVVDVPPGRVVPQVYWLQAIAEDFQRRYGGIIVRLTGSYER